MDKVFQDPILDLEELSEFVESPRFIKKPKDGLSVQKVQEEKPAKEVATEPKDNSASLVNDEFLNSLENGNVKEDSPENQKILEKQEQEKQEQEKQEQERREAEKQRALEEQKALEEEELRKQKEAEREKRKEEVRRRKEQEASNEANNIKSSPPNNADDEATVLLGHSDKQHYPTLTDKETGEVHEIDKRIYTCGKRRNSNLEIQNNVVSRKHAAFIKRDNKLYLKDLGSLNGTYIEDFKLPKNLEVELKDNQTIIFANKEFIINL